MAPPTSTAPCGDDEICCSPTLSSASGISIVSIDSIFSNPDMICPPTLEAPVAQPACGSETPAGIQLITDDSFVRHDKYFFKDGNITFLVRAPPNIGLRHPAHRRNFRSMAPSSASIDTFSLVIRPTSPPDSPYLASVITKHCLRSCHWVT
jgi:hypothetical protein